MRIITPGYFLGGLAAVLGAVSGCAKPAQPERVVARVGEMVITETEVAGRLKILPAEVRAAIQTEAGRKEFLDGLVNQKMVLALAHQQKLGERPGMTQRMNDARDQILIAEMLRELQKTALLVEPQAIQQYYTSHRDLYTAPIEVRASHILLRTEEEARDALARLKKGADFKKLAASISQDPSTAVRGGDLNYFGRGDLLPDFEREAFRLKKGETSGVVRTPYGYHVIRVTDRRKAKPRSLEQATPEIRRVLEKERFEKWIATTRQQLKVTADYAALQSIAQADLVGSGQ